MIILRIVKMSSINPAMSANSCFLGEEKKKRGKTPAIGME